MAASAAPPAELLQRYRNRLARLRRLLGDRGRKLAELAAQGVDLVDQGDHRLDRIVVETDIVDQFDEEPDTGDVDRLETPRFRRTRRPQQAARHPALDMHRGEALADAQQVGKARHVNCSMSFRGS